MGRSYPWHMGLSVSVVCGQVLRVDRDGSCVILEQRAEERYSFAGLASLAS